MTRDLSFLWTATEGAAFVYLWSYGRWLRLDATEEARTPRALLQAFAWVVGGPAARRYVATAMDFDRALEGTAVVRRLEIGATMTLDDLFPTPREFLDFLERRSAA